ncbi:EscU/YscU/HrcU family type III secretion system export apparatus switch protein [Sandarakinorhabdus sp.]|uniref:EscU/YscU/HrcU family type III secretion system export apparatus switch protein n=1 Tax=Sandarakinorhabdus sp. TaxID=1916663 RepID=UPI00286E85FF|nr:EscU/YscU/HrcU family type III secretion system export apparatus switch protein [Sandarakinorhabdus sp.]
MSGEKTESATPRRREQAVREGNIWQPKELPTAVTLAVAALAASMAGPAFWQALLMFMGGALGRADLAQTPELSGHVGTWPLLWPLALAAAIATMAIATTLAITRNAAFDRLVPKAERINPAAGLKRLFSMTGLAGAGTAIAKLLAVVAVGGFAVLPLLPRLARLEAPGLPLIGAALVRLIGVAALLLAAVAVLDGAISWVLREQKLKMSKDEVRRESRENDGAPELKAAIKRAQYAAAGRRMQKTLADASVVVVNPVHFAVALRYLPGSDMAPVVVEKGRLDMAHAVIAAARELGIPVVRTPRLARALFWSARRGEPVKEELFQAVATILAFVMRFERPDDEAVPDVFVPAEYDFDETGARRKPGAPLPL